MARNLKVEVHLVVHPINKAIGIKVGPRADRLVFNEITIGLTSLSGFGFLAGQQWVSSFGADKIVRLIPNG